MASGLWVWLENPARNLPGLFFVTTTLALPLLAWRRGEGGKVFQQ